MTTRYSLPTDAPQTDSARVARTLAAVVLVTTVLALSLLAVVIPADEPASLARPDTQGASEPGHAGA